MYKLGPAFIYSFYCSVATVITLALTWMLVKEILTSILELLVAVISRKVFLLLNVSCSSVSCIPDLNLATFPFFILF